MKPCYTFDPERFRLGSLCKRKHRWNGQEQSLRYASKSGGCVECKRADTRKRYQDPERKARILDAQRQRRNDPDQRARILAVEHRSRQKNCKDPAKAQRRREANRERSRRRYQDPLQRRRILDCQKERYRDPVERGRILRRNARYRQRLRQDPAERERTLAVQREQNRKRYQDPERRRRMLEASKKYQVRRKQDPGAKALVREIQRRSRQKCYMDPEKRTRILSICREARHRRRALLAKANVEPITSEQKLSRWAEFDNCCAYCRATGRMDVEHWIPISKGGAHALANILPACPRCNRSKWNREPEAWYRSQPCFSEGQLGKIRQVLGL